MIVLAPRTRSWSTPLRRCPRSSSSRWAASRHRRAHSRRTDDPVDVYRAARRRCSRSTLPRRRGLEIPAFEDNGAYRLLLPAMSEDPGEFERFYEETVAPLSVYDEQYETELVATVEAYLGQRRQRDADGRDDVHAPPHDPLPARAREELSGHDMSSTEGREKLSLGLKAMRVSRDRPTARACCSSWRGGRQGAPPRRGRVIRGKDSNPRFLD